MKRTINILKWECIGLLVLVAVALGKDDIMAKPGSYGVKVKDKRKPRK